jgi:hypothetical protein
MDSSRIDWAWTNAPIRVSALLPNLVPNEIKDNRTIALAAKTAVAIITSSNENPRRDDGQIIERSPIRQSLQ